MKRGPWNHRSALSYTDIENVPIRDFVNQTTGPVIEPFRKEGNSKSLPQQAVAAQLQVVLDNQLGQLKALREHLEKKVEQVGAEREMVSQEYEEKLTATTTHAKDVATQYNVLEEKLLDVSNKIVSLGNTLEEMDTIRERSTELLSLLTYFLSFSPDSSWVFKKRKEELLGDSSRNHEAAILLRKLNVIAQQLQGKEYEETVTEIQKACDEVMDKLVGEMVAAYRNSDTPGMAACSETYRLLDSSDICLRQYISLVLEEYDKKYGTSGVYLESKNTSHVETLSKRRYSAVVTACDDFIALLKQKLPEIRQIFSYSDKVLSVLVQRISQERLQSLMLQLLDEELHEGDGPFLFSLYQYYCQVTSFSRKLKTIVSTPKKGVFVDPLMIDGLVDDIFNDFTKKYIATEVSYLTSRFRESLVKWKDTVFPEDREVSAEADDPFSHSIIKDLLNETEEAITRSIHLSGTDALTANLCEIFLIMLESLGNGAVFGILESEYHRLLSHIKTDNDKQFDEASKRFLLTAIRSSQCFKLIESFYAKNVAQPLSESVNMKTRAWSRAGELQKKLETTICKGVDSCVQGWCNSVELVLRQRRLDYRSMSIEDLGPDTPTMREVAMSIEAKRRIVWLAFGEVAPRNGERLLQEFGEALYNNFLSFITKQHSITALGGIRLFKDLGLICEGLSKFNVPSLRDRIDLLEGIAKIYIMEPQNVKQLLIDSVLNKLPEDVLSRFVRQRSDYKSAHIAKMIKGEVKE